jgi:hypothetical protein
LSRSHQAPCRKGILTSDLEGEHMVILERFGKRPSAESIAGRRARETGPFAVADRRLISQRSAEAAPMPLKLQSCCGAINAKGKCSRGKQRRPRCR